jgi:hypothetical protein
MCPPAPTLPDRTPEVFLFSLSGGAEMSGAAAFAEAAANVEAALGELRAAEASLERQLIELQLYRQSFASCDSSGPAPAC